MGIVTSGSWNQPFHYAYGLFWHYVFKATSLCISLHSFIFQTESLPREDKVSLFQLRLFLLSWWELKQLYSIAFMPLSLTLIQVLILCPIVQGGTTRFNSGIVRANQQRNLFRRHIVLKWHWQINKPNWDDGYCKHNIWYCMNVHRILYHDVLLAVISSITI